MYYKLMFHTFRQSTNEIAATFCVLSSDPSTTSVEQVAIVLIVICNADSCSAIVYFLLLSYHTCHTPDNSGVPSCVMIRIYPVSSKGKIRWGSSLQWSHPPHGAHLLGWINLPHKVPQKGLHLSFVDASVMIRSVEYTAFQCVGWRVIILQHSGADNW